MNELTLTLETVTPLFLGGAERRGAPELRPPAFRGAMRYWLRAALGGVIGDSNLDELHRLENAVFGSTDYGSPIQLRLHDGMTYRDNKILPHKQGREAGQRKAFDTQQRFVLKMSLLRSRDETIWRAACGALTLALTFGGVGLRSRRGYGTLRIVESTTPAIVPPMPRSLEGWKKYVEQVTTNTLQAMRELAVAQKMSVSHLAKEPTRYPCANQSGMIRICKPEADSATEAVRQFMLKTRNDAAFGGIGRDKRQASPLWVRPIPMYEKFGLLLVVLASNFSGSNYQRVKEFVESFDGHSISVKGWNV
jgi:CRISPR-associated protein Cmr1